MIRRPPRSPRTDTLFPYTTLFRSWPLMSEAARRLNRPAREPCRAQNEAPLPRTSTDRARGYVERRRASPAIASKTAIRNASVHAAHPSRNENVAPPPSYGRVSMERPEERRVGKEGVSKGRS